MKQPKNRKPVHVIEESDDPEIDEESIGQEEGAWDEAEGDWDNEDVNESQGDDEDGDGEEGDGEGDMEDGGSEDGDEDGEDMDVEPDEELGGSIGEYEEDDSERAEEELNGETRKELLKKLEDKKTSMIPSARDALQTKYKKLLAQRVSLVKGRERRLKLLEK